MAFANHEHVGAGVSRDDFRHRSKKLVRAPLCLGRRRSGIFPGSCFLPVELVSERIPHANSRLVHGGDSCIVRFGRSALRNLFGNGRRRRTRRLEMAFPPRRTADDSARNHLFLGPYQSPRGSALADCGGTTGRCGADSKREARSGNAASSAGTERRARVASLGDLFWIHRGVLRTRHLAASDREGAADIGSDRRIYYGWLLRRRVYRYGCVGCIRRPERKQNSKSPMDLPRFGGGSGVCDLLSELLALAGMDNCGSRRHQRGAVRFLGDSNAVSHRHRRRRRPCFHQRGTDGRRLFATFYYGMAEGSYRIIQCGSRGHGGFPDTGDGVDRCAEVVCPRRVTGSGKYTKAQNRIRKSTNTFLVPFCDPPCAFCGLFPFSPFFAYIVTL